MYFTSTTGAIGKSAQRPKKMAVPDDVRVMCCVFICFSTTLSHTLKVMRMIHYSSCA